MEEKKTQHFSQLAYHKADIMLFFVVVFFCLGVFCLVFGFVCCLGGGGGGGSELVLGKQKMLWKIDNSTTVKKMIETPNNFFNSHIITCT